MRAKDWADNLAEEVFDLVRAAEDDEVVTRRIASELRKAYLVGLKELPVGILIDDQGSRVLRFQVTLSSSPPEDVLTKEYVQKHGKLTYLEDMSLAFGPNTDDMDRNGDG